MIDWTTEDYSETMINIEEDRIREEWLNPTEEAVVHEVHLGILSDLVIDHADIIVVFKLGDVTQYTDETAEPETPGSTVCLRVSDRIVENNRIYSDRPAVRIVEVVICYLGCPTLIDEQTKGRFGACPTEQDSEKIKAEILAILCPFEEIEAEISSLLHPSGPESEKIKKEVSFLFGLHDLREVLEMSRSQIIAADLFIFEYCWDRVPTNSGFGDTSTVSNVRR